MNLIMRFYIAIVFCLMFTACEGQSAQTSNENMIYERVDNATFKTKMAEDNVVILDVRTPGETAQGTIEGAKLIDYRNPDFKQKIAKLDKDKTYLIYCRSGGRSSSAAKLMQELGFSKIYELKNGYSGWN